VTDLREVVGVAEPFLFAFGDLTSSDRLSDRAIDQLRTSIITLRLEPGTVLDETVLCRRLNCGRTPFREAIQRLTEERLVTILPRRAAAVSPITVTDLQQIYEARANVEPTLARLAAMRATPAQLGELEQTVTPLLAEFEGRNVVEIVRHDFLFHYLLARAADNQYLSDCARRILGPAMRLTFLAHKHGQPSKQTHEEHLAILRTLGTRDPEAAGQAMRHHIAMAKERTLHRL
jgi:DNA-binding GntR family transcriptional regulator